MIAATQPKLHVFPDRIRSVRTGVTGRLGEVYIWAGFRPFAKEFSLMAGYESHEAGFSDEDEIRFWREEVQRRRRENRRVTPRPGFLVELSGQAIPLDYVEYRLLEFLSARPYKAFTRRQIAEAITSAEFPVTEATLDGYVMSLREKLGLFSDYVQTVPYVGYRFKE